MNIHWLPAPELVREADEAPWTMRGARAIRRLNYSTQVRTSFGGALMFALGSITAFMVAVQLPHDRVLLLVLGVMSALTAISLCVLVLVLDPRVLIRTVPPAALLALPSGVVLISVALGAGGTKYASVAILYVESPLFAFYMFRRWAASLFVLLVAVGDAIALAWTHMAFGPAFANWFVVTTTVGAAGYLVGTWAARAEELSESERAARTELAELNATLEARVAAQVGELDRLGKMRRFLSPQIADAVVSGGDDELLQPHRRRIAVMFCDLRGFTAFTNNTEPEEVVQVLDEYYHAVGQVLREREATIGGYAGDGVMAYFGDPVPRETPALDGINAALRITPVLDDLCHQWARRGHEIGYGIGLAYGYATLGVVGFDGRYDYTPLGAVVNLAARLCANADNGQVLIDRAMHAEIGSTIDTVQLVGFELKGFGPDTHVHAVGSTKRGASDSRC